MNTESVIEYVKASNKIQLTYLDKKNKCNIYFKRNFKDLILKSADPEMCKNTHHIYYPDKQYALN